MKHLHVAGLITGSVSLLVLSVVILYVYGVQTNRYPYTSATTTWKWFYRDALPDQHAFDLKPWQLWKTRVTRVRKAYTDQLPTFKTGLQRLQSDATNVDQDMEQLYSLHINEKYKNIYLSRLRTIFNRGLVLTLIAALLGGAFGLYEECQHQQTVVQEISGPNWQARVEYRSISPSLAEHAELVARVTFCNKANSPLSIRKLFIVGTGQWRLPSEVTYDETPPIIVGPKKVGTTFATLKLSRDARDEMTGMELEVQ